MLIPLPLFCACKEGVDGRIIQQSLEFVKFILMSSLSSLSCGSHILLVLPPKIQNTKIQKNTHKSTKIQNGSCFCLQYISHILLVLSATVTAGLQKLRDHAIGGHRKVRVFYEKERTSLLSEILLLESFQRAFGEFFESCWRAFGQLF